MTVNTVATMVLATLLIVPISAILIGYAIMIWSEIAKEIHENKKKNS